MTSGQTVSIFVLAVIGIMGAADAGRVGEDGTGAAWVAPELLEAVGAHTWLACNGETWVQATDLPLDGKITFEWLPATGELTFSLDGMARAVTLPEDVPLQASTLAARRCESR